MYGTQGFSPAISAFCRVAEKVLSASAGTTPASVRELFQGMNPQSVPGIDSFLSVSQRGELQAAFEGRALDRPEVVAAALRKLLVVESALQYHSRDVAGKLEVRATKSLMSQGDLANAYSPGVAYPCQEIDRDPLLARVYTARGNLIGHVTDGSSPLGIKLRWPFSSKPIGEGKGNLFFTFAGINVFNLELEVRDADHFIDAVSTMWPSFGAMNLEDISAPQCFKIVAEMRQRLKDKVLPMPLWHDDQDGTAVVVTAALINALKVQGKFGNLSNLKIVVSGAGAAGISCSRMIMRTLDIKKEQIIMLDSIGVIRTGRADFQKTDHPKWAFAQNTGMETLQQVIAGADVLLGLSRGNIVTQEMVVSMGEKPIILALANPDPEIMPEVAHEVRKDIVIATGRSDRNNQANNVLAFPGMLAAVLDVGARTIVPRMMSAAAFALADLAHEPVPPAVQSLYSGTELVLGPNYILPTPFDPRVLLKVAPAVAEAAIESKLAMYPYQREQYLQYLQERRLRHSVIHL